MCILLMYEHTHTHTHTPLSVLIPALQEEVNGATLVAGADQKKEITLNSKWNRNSQDSSKLTKQI